jgi:hypothetical protein
MSDFKGPDHARRRGCGVLLDRACGPKGRRNRGAAAGGGARSRPDQRARRPLLLLSAGAARGRGDQGRGSRLRRSGAAARGGPGAQSKADGGVLPRPERGQAFGHDQPQAPGGQGRLPPSRRRRGRGGRELPARGHGPARPRLRGAQGDQAGPRLLRDLGLRPGRSATRQSCLRPDHPGALGRDERDRRPAYRAAARGLSGLRHDGRDHRRLRDRRGAVPPDADRRRRGDRRLDARGDAGRHGAGRSPTG